MTIRFGIWQLRLTCHSDSVQTISGLGAKNALALVAHLFHHLNVSWRGELLNFVYLMRANSGMEVKRTNKLYSLFKLLLYELINVWAIYQWRWEYINVFKSAKVLCLYWCHHVTHTHILLQRLQTFSRHATSLPEVCHVKTWLHQEELFLPLQFYSQIKHWTLHTKIIKNNL